MTDNDIIKALECCSNAEPCSNCPYQKQCDETDLAEIALDLINRQKAEIESLEKDSKRLKKVQMQLDDAMKMYSTIKAEAIKEFAERLKEKWTIASPEPYNTDAVEVLDSIDNLAKEMVGDK